MHVLPLRQSYGNLIFCVADGVAGSTNAANSSIQGTEALSSASQSSIDELESNSVGETGILGNTADNSAWRGNSSANATRALVCPTLVVPDNYAPDDEPPRTGKPISHYVHSPRSREKPQRERVLILAANSGGSCALQLGDYYTFLSLLDKLQYGNVHGYDVLLGLGNVDIDLRKTWNKVAWMQKVNFVTKLVSLSQCSCSC